ncbi:MAG TPA: hypothetical protein VK778_07180, partial [Solirubrobacteraceae bacterium]|nr:hypothetical protein [Solirubrobacteraceae bacterium]
STSRRNDGFPGDFIGALPVNSVIHPAGRPINTSTINVLRGPVETAQNQSVFMEAYDIPRVIRRREIEPIHVLIYGRQRENPEAIAKLRRHLTTRTRFVVPYEHLKPDAECFGYLSAQLRTAGYEAVSVPPTVTVGPRHASEWRLIHGKAEAVACSDWMSVERRAFLAGRFAYWDEWGRDGRGIVRVADEE